MQMAFRELVTDSTLGIDNQEKREIAKQVLEFLWSLCLEETVLEHQVSLQTHKMSIDCFIEILTSSYYPAIP
jgi:hypothetical protein